MQDLKNEVQKVMEANRRVKFLKDEKGIHKWQYTVPSPDAYPYQWLWDSCFHAIILSHFDILSAKKEILSLFSGQFANGMIPHIIYWEKKEGVIDIAWGTGNTSSITQPPMIAYAVWEIFGRDRDEKFLEEAYSGLYHFYKYLLNDRDPHEQHLIGIINPDESGEDNSPRFDGLLDLPPKHPFEQNFNKRLKLVEENKTCGFDAPFCMKNFFWVKDVPMNAIMVENLRVLAKIARTLDHGYDAEYFERKSDEMITAMHTFMREDDLFYSTFGEEYKKIRVKTWAIFAPLFTQMFSEEEARAIVDNHLLNENEFWCEYGVPTVSMDEPSFDPEDLLWRGPTWIAVNWFLYKGLLRYGFNDVAGEIKKKSVALLEKSGFREQYNPLTGAGGGAHDFTWGGLVLDME